MSHRSGTSDPYVRIIQVFFHNLRPQFAQSIVKSTWQDGESLHKTRTKRRTLDPVWDSEVELFLRGTPRLNLKVDSFTKISFLVGLSVNYSLFRCMIGTELSLTTLWVDIANSNNKKHLRGAPETNFRSKLGFCPKRLDYWLSSSASSASLHID